MPLYATDAILYKCFAELFRRIEDAEPAASEAILKSGLAIRFRCSEPAAEITIDGRKAPIQIVYGDTSVKPLLDISLTAATLHEILLGELRLSKALGSGRMKATGPVWKSFVLEPLFHSAQDQYPLVLDDCGAGRGADNR